jgi:hypothetical protein
MARRNRTRSSVFTDTGKLDVAVCERALVARDISLRPQMPARDAAVLGSVETFANNNGASFTVDQQWSA